MSEEEILESVNKVQKIPPVVVCANLTQELINKISALSLKPSQLNMTVTEVIYI